MTISINSFRPSLSLRRIAAAGLVVSALLGAAAAPAQATPCYFGECERAPAPAKSDFEVIARHGTWRAQTDGKTMFVGTRFDDGSEFAIADKNEKLFLVFTYKGWHWKEGRKFPLKVTIDGEVFNGTIEAASDTMLIAENVQRSFVKAFYNGRKAKIEVAGDTFTIESLKDGAATIDDAVAYQKKSASR